MANPSLSMLVLITLSLVASPIAAANPAEGEEVFGTPVPGYRGIWYAVEKTNNKYVYKYSGGLGTYCAKHIPMAVYAPEVDKTFFVYGGTSKTGDSLHVMISYYDHKTGQVPQPVRVIDKKTEDAHDNPVLSIDAEGHLWFFASAHGRKPKSYIFKSLRPYDITQFEKIADYNYSYPQPWYIEGKGFLFLHTWYEGGRGLYFRTSADGQEWSDRAPIALIGQGHYQVSWPWKGRVGSAFNYHPKKEGLNFRTNLYYMHTADMGKTWTTVDGKALSLPLNTIENAALVHDYASENRLVYMKDLNYDADGNPIILHLTSGGWVSGPEAGPRTWRVAHWTGGAWAFHDITESDNNYDSGSIFVAENGAWRVVGPTESGPQPFNTGGEMAVWVSADQGATWKKEHQLTAGSTRNHTYARRPLGAQDEFQAFWADGHGREPSTSHLFFWNRKAGEVRQMPYAMESEMATPIVLNTVK